MNNTPERHSPPSMIIVRVINRHVIITVALILIKKEIVFLSSLILNFFKYILEAKILNSVLETISDKHVFT